MKRFLAYDSDIGIFVPEFIDKEGNAVITFNDGEGEVQIKSRHIMTFTGLLDRKVDPIYEGHIINAYNKNWKVILSQGCYMAKSGRILKQLRNMDCEIVGNIFQNYKLLTQEG